jgi:hypothetical protein
MLENMARFRDTVNSDIFKNKIIILVLSKKDIFQQKLASEPLREFFTDYSGSDDDVNASMQFIGRKFKECDDGGSNSDEKYQRIHVHYVCGVDEQQVDTVFSNIQKYFALTRDLNQGGQLRQSTLWRSQTFVDRETVLICTPLKSIGIDVNSNGGSSSSNSSDNEIPVNFRDHNEE